VIPVIHDNGLPVVDPLCPSWMYWDSEWGRCMPLAEKEGNLEVPPPVFPCPDGQERNVYGGCGPFGPEPEPPIRVTTAAPGETPWYQNPVVWAIGGLILLGMMQKPDRKNSWG